jgi:hypothetical protein
MTGNTTQTVLDAVDLLRRPPGVDQAVVRARFARILRGIVWFAGGCAFAALPCYWIGFWSLALPALIGAVTALLHDRIGAPQPAAH